METYLYVLHLRCTEGDAELKSSEILIASVEIIKCFRLIQLSRFLVKKYCYISMKNDI